jgi:hypothetical protein
MNQGERTIQARCPPLSRSIPDTRPSHRPRRYSRTSEELVGPSATLDIPPVQLTPSPVHPLCVEPATPIQNLSQGTSSTVHGSAQPLETPTSLQTQTSHSPPLFRTQTSHSPPLPSSSRRQTSNRYQHQGPPMETLQSYIQDLHIVEVARTPEAPPHNRIPLCPFILAHLQPSSYLLPHVPLHLPTCPDYSFYLLYVLKETTISSVLGAMTIDYIAVFSMIPTGLSNKYPTLVGARASYAFVEKVRASVQAERERANGLLIQAQRTAFTHGSSTI